MDKQCRAEQCVVHDTQAKKAMDCSELIGHNLLTRFRHMCPQQNSPGREAKVEYGHQHCPSTRALTPTRKHKVRDQAEEGEYGIQEAVLEDVGVLAAAFCTKTVVFSKACHTNDNKHNVRQHHRDGRYYFAHCVLA